MAEQNFDLPRGTTADKLHDWQTTAEMLATSLQAVLNEYCAMYPPEHALDALERYTEANHGI